MTSNPFDGDLFGSWFPTWEIRGDDRLFTASLSFFNHHPNDGKIYAALWDLSQRNGRSIGNETRAVRIGYTELTKCSGRCTRALGRAWPRLLSWGFLVSTENHEDRTPALYRVRSLALVDALYQDAGCTHYRILSGGKIQPFRAKLSGEQEAE